MARDGTEYLAKGPLLSPGMPYLAANELIVARIAARTGVPTPQMEVVVWKDALFAGSQLLPDDRKFTGRLTTDKWERMLNAPDVAYPLVVLDVWMLNTDRHEDNWLGEVKGGGKGVYYAIDHDMCPIWPGSTPDDLAGRVTMEVGQQMLRCDPIRDAIVDPRELRRAIAMAKQVDDDALRAIVYGLPVEWMDEEEKGLVHDFLCQRRDELPALLDRARRLLPNLRTA